MTKYPNTVFVYGWLKKFIRKLLNMHSLYFILYSHIYSGLEACSGED